MQKENIGTDPIQKLLLKYSIPAITGMLVNALYNIINRIFIGRIQGIGVEALSGVGITIPIMLTIGAFGMLVGVGATANISINLGKGDKKRAQSILGNAIFLSITISIILSVVGLIFCDSILKAFGASSVIMPYAKQYIIVLLFGTIFNVTSFSINHTIRTDGKPIVSASIMVIGCVANVILDPIFIFGLKMGIQGASIATVISQALTTILIFIYYLGGFSNMAVTFESLRPRISHIKKIISIGLSPFSMQIATSCVVLVFNNRLKLLGGDVTIGAFAIISSISTLFLMPIFGLNQGGQHIIGFNYGAKNYDRVKKALFLIISAGTIYLIGGFVLVQFFPSALIGLFSSETSLLEKAIYGIRINMFTLPLLAVCILGTTFFANIGKAKISLSLNLFRQFIMLIPMIFLLSHYFGLTGVWLAQPICDAVSFVLVSAFALLELKKQKQNMI